MASKTQVTQIGGPHGQGTTLERVSSLPAPTAEPRQPERKKSALTAEPSTGKMGAEDNSTLSSMDEGI